jgi:hypothetical protein
MLVAKKNPDKNLDQEMKSRADQVGLKACRFWALRLLQKVGGLLARPATRRRPVRFSSSRARA